MPHHTTAHQAIGGEAKREMLAKKYFKIRDAKYSISIIYVLVIFSFSQTTLLM